ncbi:uncharacterized protein CCR75_007818 [Bremia lactucae]|uniref:PH domain-containing protein n=1 Tax=Bremia lactucae TaxID=4779 RepID=A0A976P007_BRELC|nr:hypothetical protein CCR75_007818 [Bremia lactucae]
MSRRQALHMSSERRHTHTGVNVSAMATAPLNCARRLSLDQTAIASTIYCEGYVHLKRRNMLPWNTRFLVLSNSHLQIFPTKQDACLRCNILETLEIVSGRIAPKHELGIELTTTEGRELLGRVLCRADQTQWISAFYQLAMRSVVRRVKSESMDVEGTAMLVDKRRVSFYKSVQVRTIPTVPTEQVSKLFYSKKDVQKFSEQASSLFSRTEDAMSLVFRKPWRKQVI